MTPPITTKKYVHNVPHVTWYIQSKIWVTPPPRKRGHLPESGQRRKIGSPLCMLVRKLIIHMHPHLQASTHKSILAKLKVMQCVCGASVRVHMLQSNVYAQPTVNCYDSPYRGPRRACGTGQQLESKNNFLIQLLHSPYLISFTTRIYSHTHVSPLQRR